MFDAATLLQLAQHAASPALLLALVYAATFILEEGATSLAVLLVMTGRLPAAEALIVLFLGVVSSDLALYALGYSTRRLPWFSRFVDVAKLEGLSHWMTGNMGKAVVMSRLLPWMLPPTFMAFGYFGLSFRRFAFHATLTAAAWTACASAFAFGVGNKAIGFHDVRSWMVLAAAALILSAWRAAPSLWHRYRMATPNATTPAFTTDAGFCNEAVSRSAWSTRLPTWMFYTPVVIYYIWLALRYRSFTLPTIANPGFECGGFCGESKEQAFLQMGGEAKRRLAPYILVPETVLALANDLLAAKVEADLHEIGLAWPVVAKPDVGHNGYGVRLIHSSNELIGYLKDFPARQALILQRWVDMPGEAGVFFVRMPGEKQGRIISLALSTPPALVAKGSTPTADGLNAAAASPVSCGIARSHRLGATLHDARHLQTPDLLQRFEQISADIHGFYFGRFDVRFQSLESFRRGEDFSIVEVNGAGAEVNHIWDQRMPLRLAWHDLFAQYALLFQVANLNRAAGHRPLGVTLFWHYVRKHQKTAELYAAVGY